MFDQRIPGMGIMFTGSYSPKEPLKQEVCEGDSVELRIGEERIRVDGIRLSSFHVYRGRIQGFTPSHAVEFQGLKLGQEVEFSLDRIHGCDSNA